MSDAVLITSTAGSRVEAEMIARTLIERRLAACVQLSDVASLYRRQGEVKQAAEVLLLVKTTAARAKEAEATISRLHSYDTPEIVRLPITGGSAAYLAWVGEAVE